MTQSSQILYAKLIIKNLTPVNLTQIDYEKSIAGKIKNRQTKEDQKDKELQVLKLKYVYGEMDSIELSLFSPIRLLPNTRNKMKINSNINNLT